MNLKPTVIKVEDIPRIIFSRKFDGKPVHFQGKNGNYSEKNFVIGKKEGKIIFGKCSGCYILIVLFIPFERSVKYDILIRTGNIEKLICKELQNDDKDEFVSYCKGLALNIRKIDNAVISELIMDTVSRIINKQK